MLSALGGRHKRLLTQAVQYDAAHPEDGEYVENVMWEQSQGLCHFIDSIAAHAAAFGKPVLLFNGDSHVYRSDNPLM